MEKNNHLTIFFFILAIAGANAYPQGTESDRRESSLTVQSNDVLDTNQVINENDTVERILVEEIPRSDPYSEMVICEDTFARVKREKTLTPHEREAKKNQDARNLVVSNVVRRAEQARQRQEERLQQARDEARRAMNQNARFNAEVENHWNRRN